MLADEIADRQELCGLLESQLGVVVPSDTDEPTFRRDLLTALKTASATKRLLAAQARAKGRNPDAPDPDQSDLSEDDLYGITHQFSTAGDRTPRRRRRLDEAEIAKAAVDRQEAFHKNPNFVRRAY